MSTRCKQIYLAIAAFGFLLSAALFGVFFGITPARAAGTPERISIEQAPGKWIFYDDTLATVQSDGLIVVTGHYSDGSSAELAAGGYTLAAAYTATGTPLGENEEFGEAARTQTVTFTASADGLEASLNITPLTDRIVSITAEYTGGTLYPYSSVNKNFVSVTGLLHSGGTQVFNPTQMSSVALEYDLAASPTNASDTYEASITVTYDTNSEFKVDPYEATVTVQKAEPTDIWIDKTGTDSDSVGDPFALEDYAATVYYGGSVGNRSSKPACNTANFAFSYMFLREGGEAVPLYIYSTSDKELVRNPGVTDEEWAQYSDKNGFEFNIGYDYVTVYYIESGCCVSGVVEIEISQRPIDAVPATLGGIRYVVANGTSAQAIAQKTYQYTAESGAAVGIPYEIALGDSVAQFDPDIMTVSVFRGDVDVTAECADANTGVVRVTDAGEYTIGVGLQSGYYWSCNSEANIEYTLTVAPAVPPVTVTAEDWTYGAYAEEYSPVVSGNYGGADVTYYFAGTPNGSAADSYNSTVTVAAGAALTAGQVPTEAGSYSVYVSVAASADGNFAACSMAEEDAVSFTIGRAQVKTPERGTDYVDVPYSAEPQSVALVGELRGLVTADCDPQTDAREYPFTATLQDENNYQWADFTSDIHEAKTLEWAITQYQDTEITSLSVADRTFGELPAKPEFSWTFGTTLSGIVPTYTYYYDADGDGTCEQKLSAAPTAQSPAGNYKLVAVIEKTDNYAASPAKEAFFAIARRGVQKPAITGTYVYSGREQTVAFDYDGVTAGYFTVAGGTQTDAGTHTVTVTLTGNYCWQDGSAEPLTLPWVILRKGIAKPAVTGDAAYYTYSGSVIAAAYENSEYLDTWFTAEETLSATDAGEYSFTLTPTANYCWGENGSSEIGGHTLTWNIAPKQIVAPTADDTNFTYRGSIGQTYTIGGFDADAMRVAVTAEETGDEDGLTYTENGATVTALHAGNYTIEVRLASGNYAWADGGEAERTFVFTIAKATASISSLTAQGWTYGFGPVAPVVQANCGQAVFAYAYNKEQAGNYAAVEGALSAASPAGYYQVTATVPASGDWHASAPVTEHFIVDRFGVARPAIAGKYVYTMEPQTVAFDYEGVTLGYFTVADGTQTDAGSYTVTVTLTDNYKWEDDPSRYAEQERDLVFEGESAWVIAPRSLARLSLTAQTEVEDDDTGTPRPQNNAIVDYDDTYGGAAYVFSASPGLSRSGAVLTARNAGTYTVTVSLASDNFVWKGEGDEEYLLTWVIAKKAVSVPATPSEDRLLEYVSDQAQYPASIYDSVRSSVYYSFGETKFWQYAEQGGKTETGETIEKGMYYLCLQLNDPANFCWQVNAGDAGADAWQIDTIENSAGAQDGKFLYVWYEITAKQYTENATLTMGGFEYGESAPAPAIVLDMDADAGLAEVQASIEEGKIAYYYSGTTLGGGQYGAGETYGTTAVPTDAGTYYIVAVVEATANYARTIIGYRGAQKVISFTIAPRQLTASFSPSEYTFVYGSSAAASVSFKDGSEPVDLETEYTYAKDGQTYTDESALWAGEYTVTATISDHNYYISKKGEEYVLSASARYLVKPKDLTVSVAAQSVIYGEQRAPWEISATGWVNDGEKNDLQADFLALVASEGVACDYAQDSAVGSYPVTLRAPVSALAAGMGNYNVIYNDAGIAVTVQRRAITVTVYDKTTVYGEAVKQFTASESNAAEGQTGSAVFRAAPYTLQAYDGVGAVTLDTVSPAGTYRIVGVLTAEGEQNYTVTFAGESGGNDGNYVIAPAEIGVTEVAYTAQYTGAEQNAAILQQFAAAVTLVNPDKEQNEAFAFSLTEGNYGSLPTFVGVTKNAGADGAVTVYYQITADNHATKTGTFTVQITRAPLTVRVQDSIVDYGFDVDKSKFKLDFEGFLKPDGAQTAVDAAGVTYSVSAQGTPYAAGAAAGTVYSVTAADVTSENYSLTFVSDGTLTVVARKIEVTLLAQTAVYAGQGHEYALGGAYDKHYAAEWGGAAQADGKVNVSLLSGGETALYGEEDPALRLQAVMTAYDVGNYKIELQAGGNGNYTATVTNEDNALFEVTPLGTAVTITANSCDYGSAAAATAEADGRIGDDDMQFGFTYTGRNGTSYGASAQFPKAVGDYTVTVTLGNRNYTLTGTDFAEYTVSPKQVTVTAEDKTVVYGNAAPAFTAAFGGLVYGETAESLGLVPSFACAYVAGAQGGSVTESGYAISVEQTLVSANYTFDYADGTLTVTARPIKVSLLDGSSTYGNAVDLYAQANISGGALAGGDTKEQVFLLTGYTEKGDQKTVQDAGTYYIVGSPNASAAGGNYAITFQSAGGHTVGVGGERYPAGKYTVSQQPVFVRLTGGGDHTFNGAPKTVEASYSETGITITVWYTGTGDTEYASAEAPVNVGTYHVTCVVDDPNYSAASVSTDLIILPKTITIEWAANAYTYNGEVQAVTALYKDVGGAEHSLALTITEGGAQFRDAGTYTFKAAFAEGDNKQGNYALPDDPTKAYNIAPYAVTVHIDDASSEYGDPIAALTARETENAVFACDRAAGDAWWSNVFVLSTTAKQGFAASDAVTTYTISASAEGTARGTNYAFTFEGSLGATAQYTVTKRVLTVCVQGFTVAYGDAVNEEGIVLLYERKNGEGEAFYGDDDESAVTRGTFSYAYTTKTAADTRVNVLPQGLTATNYAFEYTHNDYADGAAENGGFTVTKRTVSVGDTFLQRLTGLIYNAADRWSPVQTGDLGGKGLAAGESIGAELVFVYTFTYEGKTYEYDADSAPIRDAGEYTVTVALDSSSSNYALDKAYEDLAFSIAKAPLTVTADGDLQMEGVQDILVTYGEPLSEDNIRDKYLRYEGFCGEDTALLTGIRDGLGVSFAYISDKAGRTQAGTNVPVTLTACEAANYEVSVVNGNIAVQQRKISLAADESRYYNGYIDVYGEYGGTLNAFAAVVSGKMADGDTAAEQITFTYVYGGTANNGTDELTGTFVGGEFFADTAGIHAGEYTVTVSIQSTNYVIQDGATMQFTWRILKQRVADPAWESGSMTADGGEKTNAVEYSVALAEYVQAGGNPNAPASVENNTETGVLTMQATSAGVYWAEFRLRNEYDYVWTGNTGSTGQDNAVIRVQWSISQFTDLTVTVTGVTIGGETVGTVQRGDRWWFVQGEGWTYGVTFGDFLYEATYNQGQPFQGSVQTSVYLVTGENTFESAGDYSQAGTYFVVAVIQASSDYAEARSERVYFTVLPKTLAVPTLENGTYAHGADVERPLSGFDAATMRITEDNIGVRVEESTYYIFAQNAGTYYLRIVLTDGRNYRWEDGTANEQSLQWTIERFKVTAPTLSADVSNAYNGQKQTYSYTDSEYKDYYHVAGTLSATDAGTYTVTAQLNDRSNYVWAGGGTADISVTWTIAQATNAWKTGADQYARAGWTYGQAVADETLPVASFGEAVVRYYTDEACTQEYTGGFDGNTPAGTYYVLVEVAETENYEGISGAQAVRASFTVNKAAAYAVWSDTSALVYDGQEKTVTASYFDVHGAPVELTVSVAQGVVLHAGEYTAQAQFATEDEQNNYTLQNGQTAFTVSPKAITVNILPQGAVYSGAVPVPSQQEGDGYEFAVRPVGGDELNLSFALRDGKADVGTYVIVGAWNNADYAVTFAGGAFTVSPLEIVVTFAEDMGGRYGSVTAASAAAAKADGGAAVEGVLTLTYAGTPNGGAFTDYGTAVPQDAGAYTVTAATDANHAIVGSNSAPFNIGKAQITVGDVRSVPYNGALQKAAIELTGAPESGVTVDNEGGVNAGNYNVVLTLNAEQANNYVWVYKGAEVGASQLTVSFVISPAQAEDNTVTIDVGSFDGWTFGESAALPEASAEFGSPVFYYSTERDGTYTAAMPVHAGTYWMKAVVEETVNNAASASQPVSFTVAAAQIASPAFAGGSVSVYSGAEQGNLFAGYDRSKMAIVSNDGALYSANGLYGLRATAAGEYAAVFRLVYADEYRDYVWADSATDEVTVTWTIAKAQNGWKEGADQYIRDGWKAGETAPAATLPEALFGEAVVRYYTDEACTQEYTGGFDGNTPAGTYYVVVEVAGTENYEGISGAQAVRASFTVEGGGSLVWLIAVLSCVLAAEVIMLICLLAKRRREVE